MVKILLPSLQELIKATRNGLQCVHSRLPKKNIHKSFEHNITTDVNKDRITQEFVNDSVVYYY